MSIAAPLAWGAGLLYSLAVTFLIKRLAPRLARFPKARKTGPLFYRWTTPRRPDLMAYAPTTGIKQCPCPTLQAKSAWGMYAAHQLFAWYVIYLQQLNITRHPYTPFAFGASGGNGSGNAGNASSGSGNAGNGSGSGNASSFPRICDPTVSPDHCGWTDDIHWTQALALGGHAAFMLLHVLQTHLWYDGTALDMGENTSQISVIFSTSKRERGGRGGGCEQPYRSYRIV